MPRLSLIAVMLLYLIWTLTLTFYQVNGESMEKVVLYSLPNSVLASNEMVQMLCLIKRNSIETLSPNVQYDWWKDGQLIRSVNGSQGQQLQFRSANGSTGFYQCGVRVANSLVQSNIVHFVVNDDIKTARNQSSCGPGEVYYICGPCQHNCQNLKQALFCSMRCSPAGCYCQPNYFRDFDDTCVTRDRCQKSSTTNQTVSFNNQSASSSANNLFVDNINIINMLLNRNKLTTLPTVPSDQTEIFASLAVFPATPTPSTHLSLPTAPSSSRSVVLNASKSSAAFTTPQLSSTSASSVASSTTTTVVTTTSTTTKLLSTTAPSLSTTMMTASTTSKHVASNSSSLQPAAFTLMTAPSKSSTPSPTSSTLQSKTTSTVSVSSTSTATTLFNNHSAACSLNADSGQCSQMLVRYYFNSTLKQCVQFHYGGCGGNGNNFKTYSDCSARCAAQVAPQKCQNGNQMMICAENGANSCSNIDCPATQNATCKLDPCDRCQPKWFDDAGVAIDTQTCYPKCAAGKSLVKCLIDPCKSDQCPGYPEAVCRADFCGSCRSRWYDKDNGSEVSNLCAGSSGMSCPHGSMPVNCTIVDLCFYSNCPQVPDARCVKDYCSGCRIRFFNKHNQDVTVLCNGGIPCADGAPLYPCQFDPCHSSSCSVPNAKCKPNYCGGCNAVWLDASGKDVTLQCSQVRDRFKIHRL